MKKITSTALLAGALACVAVAAPASAQGAAPAKTTAAAEEDDPSKFFWFHKPDVTPAVARVDIETCFVQVGAIAGRQQTNPGASMGLIGALVGGVINGITQGVEARRMRDAAMRTCMGLYGYGRYRVAEAEWNAMMRAPDALDRLSGFAAGTQPVTERLDA